MASERLEKQHQSEAVCTAYSGARPQRPSKCCRGRCVKSAKRSLQFFRPDLLSEHLCTFFIAVSKEVRPTTRFFCFGVHHFGSATDVSPVTVETSDKCTKRKRGDNCWDSRAPPLRLERCSGERNICQDISECGDFSRMKRGSGPKRRGGGAGQRSPPRRNLETGWRRGGVSFFLLQGSEQYAPCRAQMAGMFDGFGL
ncbi:hypothetical protein HG535_0F05430 [Zygotorulaspora mrakii]|uniref:Uncharacterized protein n=1 Tax=Zygotorulaspora mrakii TaxID=42260 RepID=A0A7H9B5P7_ZYGMR|nr:uncharacterized protein HG535_0F05430 [Zygotorulaspora mrakii]QLG74031.1 hypothetical protein HG535_0F05430 [Zygotorulaspora mrakii]